MHNVVLKPHEVSFPVRWKHLGNQIVTWDEERATQCRNLLDIIWWVVASAQLKLAHHHLSNNSWATIDAATCIPAPSPVLTYRKLRAARQTSLEIFIMIGYRIIIRRCYLGRTVIFILLAALSCLSFEWLRTGWKALMRLRPLQALGANHL